MKHAATQEFEWRAARADGGMAKKPSNPKDSVGVKKVPRSVIPLGVLWELGVALLEGALKYGRHNYRAIGVRASVYYDAAARHMDAWWEGEDLDPDSGLSHVTKAIASLTVLRDSMIRSNWVDDRPPMSNPHALNQLNEVVAKLIEEYPNPTEAWTEKRLMAEKAKAYTIPHSVESTGEGHSEYGEKHPSK